MTAKELAAMLSGREVRNEIAVAEAMRAGDDGLVVVYGYSDDEMDLRGAIHEEIGAYEGVTIYVNKVGLMYEPPCDGEGCPY